MACGAWPISPGRLFALSRLRPLLGKWPKQRSLTGRPSPSEIAHYFAFSASENDIDANYTARSIRDEVAGRIKTLQSQYPRFQPQLAIIQAGARPDSSVYVRMKAKAAEEVGIKFKHITIPEAAAVEDVVETVQKLNNDPSISGVLVQLPLGPHVGSEGERLVTEAVSPEKDVDGYVRSRKCA